MMKQTEKKRRGRRRSTERLGLSLYGTHIELTSPLFRPGMDRLFNLSMRSAAGAPVIVWQAGDRAEWLRSFGAEPQLVRSGFSVPQGILADFIELDNAPDNDIFAFATKWGPLGIWPCDVTANLGSVMEISAGLKSRGLDPDAVGEFLMEPVSLYRRMARRCKLILTVKALIEVGSAVGNEIWAELLDPNDVADVSPEEWFIPGRVAVFPAVSILGAQQCALRRAAMLWVLQVPMFFYLHWNEITHEAGKVDETHMRASLTDGLPGYGLVAALEGQDMERNAVIWVEDSVNSDLRRASTYRFAPPRPSHTFGAIVAQMVAALVSPNGIPLCKICGRPLVALRRRPRSDRSALCGRQECDRIQMKRRSEIAHQKRKEQARAN